MTPILDFVGGILAGAIIGGGLVIIVIGVFLWLLTMLGAPGRRQTALMYREYIANLERQISNFDSYEDSERLELIAILRYFRRQLRDLEKK